MSPNKGISKSIYEIPPPHQILAPNTQSKHTIREFKNFLYLLHNLNHLFIVIQEYYSHNNLCYYANTIWILCEYYLYSIIIILPSFLQWYSIIYIQWHSIINNKKNIFIWKAKMRTRFYEKRVICSLPMESGQPRGNNNSVWVNKWYMRRQMGE